MTSNLAKNWRRLSASARAAVPKLYIAIEQADMFALLDALDRIMLELDTVDAEAMSDEQITDLSAVLLRQKMHRNVPL
jgi:hypothetical protein